MRHYNKVTDAPARPEEVLMRRTVPAIVAVVLALTLPLAPVAAKKGSTASASLSAPTCDMPTSNAEGLEILSTYYPGYWWDHLQLTVAVQAQPNVKAPQLAAVHEAIHTWDAVLRTCFDGAITLTDVTGTQSSAHRAADIVIHYVPKAGGVVFAGYAICGDHGCPNILVTSDLPPGKGGGSYDPEYLGWVTLHELGHALGLGHATNLLESTDLMGYGWPDLGDPVLSQCDIDGLAFVFAWAIEGGTPHRPADGPFVCSSD